MESANEIFLDFQQKMMEHITGGLFFYGPVHLMGTLMRGWASCCCFDSAWHGLPASDTTIWQHRVHPLRHAAGA